MFDYDKLIDYGFRVIDGVYVFYKIFDSFTIKVIFDGELSYKVYDNDFNEEFALVGSGSFVGNIKSVCNDLIDDICFKCKNRLQVDIVKDYIFNKYGDSFEYLWKKFPLDGVFRNKINSKWYCLIMNISLDKLGINSNRREYVLNVINRDSIVDNKSIFLGYHMNKKNWITILLDDSLSNDFIFRLIDNSYDFSVK